MTITINKTAEVCGVLASLFCFAGGVWILAKFGFDFSNDAVSTGLGLYFIGKGFFVGPLLILAARGARGA